jgi:hypothetical protein
MGQPLSRWTVRYSWMASRAISKASSRVSPSVITPGRSGTETVKPTLGLGNEDYFELHLFHLLQRNAG